MRQLQLDPTSLRRNEEGRLYCRVKEGQFEAALGRTATLALGPALEESPEGAFVLALGTRRFPLALRSAPSSEP